MLLRKEIVPRKQNTNYQARVKNIYYFRSKWSNLTLFQTKTTQKPYPLGSHLWCSIAQSREYPLHERQLTVPNSMRLGYKNFVSRPATIFTQATRRHLLSCIILFIYTFLVEWESVHSLLLSLCQNFSSKHFLYLSDWRENAAARSVMFVQGSVL